MTDMHKPKLLLVDDKPNNLIALEAVLSGQGYDLISANSGAEALEVIKKEEVSLVLLDVQMPGMDGYETARRIKETEHGRNVPIIFVTAIFNEDPHIKQGYEAGAIDYFTKPFDPDILRLKVGIYSTYHQKTLLLREREKRIEQTEELLKAGRKLSAILESLPVGVMISDIEGRICQANEETLKIWKSEKISMEDSYGAFLEWWSQGGHFIKESIASVLAGGQAFHNKIVQIECLDGSAKTVLSSVSPLRSIEGQTVGSVVVIQDITEHRKIEKDMEQRILDLITLGVGLQHSTSAVQKV